MNREILPGCFQLKHFWVWSILLFCSFLLPAPVLKAEDDLVIMKNGDRIIGEIKKLNKADLHIDPDYGENVFIVDWKEIRTIQTLNNFVIETSDGSRLIGTFETDPESPDRIIIKDVRGPITVEKSHVVFLNPVKKDFWGRVDLAVDFGLGLTAANSKKKLNARLKAAYVGEKWSTSVQYDTLYDIQTDRETNTDTRIERTELRTDYRRDISGKWFALGFFGLLQSTEQQLDLRTTLGAGIGNYLVRNNRWLFSASGGANWANEKYEDPAVEQKDSAEAFAGLDLDIFDIGDLDIYSSFKVIPSFTDIGRIRIDFKTDFKWEIISDLFFRIGLSNNYDNKPPEGTPSNDYVFDTSVGWSF